MTSGTFETQVRFRHTVNKCAVCALARGRLAGETSAHTSVFMLIYSVLHAQIQSTHIRDVRGTHRHEWRSTPLPVVMKYLLANLFLDAFSHLYKKVCPSIRLSVRLSINPSVTRELNFCEMG